MADLHLAGQASSTRTSRSRDPLVESLSCPTLDQETRTGPAARAGVAYERSGQTSALRHFMEVYGDIDYRMLVERKIKASDQTGSLRMV